MAVEQLDIETHTQRLADYLPGGRVFQARNIHDSNLRKLLRGLARELFTADGYLRDFQEDIAPSVTTYFIDEWERALGIPDDCFSGSGTLSERRAAVLIKLASLGVQTADDFVELAAVFGLTVEVVSGSVSGVFPLSFPVLVFGTAEDARFTIIVNIETPLTESETFPFAFPIPFGTKEVGLLRCMFSKLVPANCNLIVRQVA
jgi:uncharacterized protein YmfQ (DUF2313 family)